jgi:hypothetical protein
MSTEQGHGPHSWGQRPLLQQAYAQTYGQTYGQPYGQRPGPGRGTAPVAPDLWAAPAPVRRPRAVHLGVGAWLASVLFSGVGIAVTFALLDRSSDRALVERGLAPADVAVLRDGATADVLAIAMVIALVLAALQLVVVILAWLGRRWARIVLWVLGGLTVVSTVAELAAGTAISGPAATVVSILQALLVAAGSLALATRPANDWYRHRARQRARGL